MSILLADWALFVGRFHPLLVHLPIGFLLLALVFECWPSKQLLLARRLTWVLGSLTAFSAVVAGWLLASGGGEDSSTLFWHRWLGVGVLSLSLVATWRVFRQAAQQPFVASALGVMLLLGGHLGGNLTHGEQYLFAYAPAWIQQLGGYEPQKEGLLNIEGNTDSLLVYATFLQPMLEEHCTSCHDSNKQNGGLRLDSPRWLWEGGDSGPALVKGQPLASLLLERMSLPRSNEKAMPPRGEAVSYTHLQLISWWIAQGADSLATLQAAEVPSELQALLKRDFGLDLRTKSFVEKLQVDTLSSEVLAPLVASVWKWARLAETNGALQVWVKRGQSVGEADLALLQQIAAAQVAELSLEGQQVSGILAGLAQFPNLYRLKLNGSDVTDSDMAALGQIPSLQSLNLHSTAVGDVGASHLAILSELQDLYLWQTAVRDSSRVSLQAHLPDLRIHAGFQFREELDAK